MKRTTLIGVLGGLTWVAQVLYKGFLSFLQAGRLLESACECWGGLQGLSTNLLL